MYEEPTHKKKPRLGGALLVGLIIVVAVLGISASKRMAANADVAKWTQEQIVPSVSIVQAKAGDSGELILPARLEAWAEAPVYARTNGYLKSWDADIGTAVTKDQVLAEIDTPEIDHELTAARAALSKVQVDKSLAKINVQRSDNLVKNNAVSQQDVDDKRSALSSLEAQSKEAQAEVERLTTLSGFKHVIAPFDGIVTTRTTDVGALIDSSSASPPLFTISDVAKLRLYVNVPETYASAMKEGLKASFTIPELPNQKFEAEVVKTSGAIDRTSGTMLVQLMVDNADGLLKPGSYAQLHFDIVDAKASLRVPASAIIFRKDGISLAVMGADNKALIKPVKIGRDFGAEVEIAEGLEANDQIIDSPPDSLATGDPVQPLKADNADKAEAASPKKDGK